MRIKPLRKEKAFFSLILVLWLTTTVYSSVAPPLDPDDSQQCTGLMLDFQRIKSVTNNDLQTVTQSLFPATGNDDNDDSNANKTSDKSYGINYIIPVQQQDTLECIMQRHRLQETKEGVPILGADIVITVKDCAPPDEYAFGGGYEQSPLSGIPLQAISDLDGITFTEVNEPKGYVPTKTRDEVRQSIAERYTIAQDKMGALDLILFPSTVGDFLSYKTEVMVVQPGDIQLYDVIVSAHTLDFLSICKKTRAHNQRIERHRELLLRGGTKDNNNIQQSANSRRLREQLNCQSCATLTSTHSDGEEIEWSEEEISCPINSLYLNDTGRTTTCVKGIAPDGQEVFGPGTVAKLFYDGTYDCMGSDTRCVANPFPTNCSDAISDIHYGVTETLRYYQRHLGVMGGLRVNANNPLRFISLAHYSTNYCNAFFTTQTNNLYFGDCDCNLWTPLTSLDVAAHELTHGMFT